MNKYTFELTDQQAAIVIGVLRAKRHSMRVWNPDITDPDVGEKIEKEMEDVKSTLEVVEGQYNEQTTSR